LAEPLSTIATFAYLPTKLVLYAVVARFGINVFQPQLRHAWRRAILAASLRALIGLAMAIPLFVLGGALQNVHHWESEVGLIVWAYLLLYIPLRWIAWSLVAPVVNPAARGVRAVAIPSGGPDVMWRSTGVIASCLVDVILVAIVGTVPVGKFFC
jgi:hypothetical protein